MARDKLSRERILQAAVELIDEIGIAKFSMRKLGAHLQVEAMTLYYYIPNKETIFDGLVEQIVVNTLNKLIAKHPLSSKWDTLLRSCATIFRQELLDHRKLIPLIATRPVMTNQSIEIVEKVIAGICSSGISPIQAFQLLNSITTFVIGHTLAEAGDTEGHEDTPADTENLIQKIDSAAYPYFHSAIENGLGSPLDHQQRFDLALDAWMIGFSALLEI
ncbi:TetR/AcrR family transcriptional regulator C-terminal domain-containing protein [Shimazuella sp. AN120528]|uniref:TetR/AcrR family transcriptional regulator C-terminal domain-containing protein n=1 Tax=Shimazuella soli TaxID=1892854 RepID=UPI001F0FB3A8|nr:TetR/AcrR family transcriptional regulator C-terminal domain-containing protein [Shimazuella soli]MCH5584412.1 TetR/AcrR family transcriptional regulator C-terminal domain-containing protein [Shimazuella soli]